MRASDQHELDVAEQINKSLKDAGRTDLTAVRPKADVAHSDIKITYNGTSRTWVEVKMAHDNALFNARPSYRNNKIVFSKKNPSAVKNTIRDKLRQPNSIGMKFINSLSKFLGRDDQWMKKNKLLEKITFLSTSTPSVQSGALVKPPTSDTGRVANANYETNPLREYDLNGVSTQVGRSPDWKDVPRNDSVVSWYELTDYILKNPDNLVFNMDKGRNNMIGYLIQNKNITDLVTTHYTKGKQDGGAHYIQTGPDFYLLGRSDPLQLNKKLKSFRKIPVYNAEGNFTFRLVLGKTEGRVELMPDLRASKLIPASPYGFDPRKLKKNPFI